MELPPNPVSPALFERAGLTRARRHVFVCIGPECCESEEGERLWELIKQRVKQTGVEAMRTKAQCFRICAGGPWLVVYPEGVWYGGVTEGRFEEILQRHLLGGVVVEEWVAASTPCGARSSGGKSSAGDLA
ncbi:MAG: hypothetical protein WCL08_06780 [Verrucomicrobiota bacterium]